MAKVKKFDATTDTLSYECPVCHTLNDVTLTHFESTLNVEFQEYKNLKVVCSACQANGQEVTTFFNMNIPEDEYEDIEFEDTVMTLDEINTRKYLRDVMWRKRKDLAGTDRAAYNLERKHKLDEWRNTQ